MPTSVKEMMAAANAAVRRLTPAETRDMVDKGALVVDVRDAAEVAASGKIKGAVAVSRGLLEFRADPEMPSHNPAFQKDRPVVLYCGGGGRAALAGKTLQEMGYQSVYNGGGFKELAEAGLGTEPA